MLTTLVILAVGAALAAVGFTTRSGGSRDAEIRPTVLGAPPRFAGRNFRVITLNVAHGRGTGRNQLLQPSSRIRDQLEVAAGLVAREQPQIIALQEADSRSFWTGGQDQVSAFAAVTGSHAYAAGHHVDGFGLHYGTAVLSDFVIRSARTHAFSPNPPTPTKGWVVATVVMPGAPNTDVDVVSVHLDFSRRSVRERQVRSMIEALEGRGRPLVLMGDLNSGWGGKGAAEILCRELSLHTWQPTSTKVTFPALDARLDWILVSQEFDVIDQRVLTTRVSDHLAVVADLRLREEKG
jgi:endonuclease/exonuclease/phosphatase family metal-dependent hydrolase